MIEALLQLGTASLARSLLPTCADRSTTFPSQGFSCPLASSPEKKPKKMKSAKGKNKKDRRQSQFSPKSANSVSLKTLSLVFFNMNNTKYLSLLRGTCWLPIRIGILVCLNIRSEKAITNISYKNGLKLGGSDMTTSLVHAQSTFLFFLGGLAGFPSGLLSSSGSEWKYLFRRLELTAFFSMWPVLGFLSRKHPFPRSSVISYGLCDHLNCSLPPLRPSLALFRRRTCVPTVRS